MKRKIMPFRKPSFNMQYHFKIKDVARSHHDMERQKNPSNDSNITIKELCF